MSKSNILEPVKMAKALSITNSDLAEYQTCPIPNWGKQLLPMPSVLNSTKKIFSLHRREDWASNTWTIELIRWLPAHPIRKCLCSVLTLQTENRMLSQYRCKAELPSTTEHPLPVLSPGGRSENQQPKILITKPGLWQNLSLSQSEKTNRFKQAGRTNQVSTFQQTAETFCRAWVKTYK